VRSQAQSARANRSRGSRTIALGCRLAQTANAYTCNRSTLPLAQLSPIMLVSIADASAQTLKKTGLTSWGPSPHMCQAHARRAKPAQFGIRNARSSRETSPGLRFRVVNSTFVRNSCTYSGKSAASPAWPKRVAIRLRACRKRLASLWIALYLGGAWALLQHHRLYDTGATPKRFPINRLAGGFGGAWGWLWPVAAVAWTARDGTRPDGNADFVACHRAAHFGHSPRIAASKCACNSCN
jgi:hypothetical protein